MFVKTIVKTAFIAIILAGSSACNTVKGLGEDIQSVGRAGEEAID